MESSNLWAKRVLGTLQRGDGNLGKGCCAAPVPVAQMPLVRVACCWSGCLLVKAHVSVNTAPHWSWVPSEPRLGPGGYTLGSGYPFGARGQAMQQDGCCCSWGPWLCPPWPLIKRGPFRGPEHPNLLTQLCPSAGMHRALEGGKGTGLQIWVWSRWWPQEDFSTSPESTLSSKIGESCS